MDKEIDSKVPVRINDLGGWTDTWFAEAGCVQSIAVDPGVTCRLRCLAWNSERPDRFTLESKDTGETYSFDPASRVPHKQPLLEATVARVGIPDDLAIVATVESEIPPGCGTGTSAAVAVALAGALKRLASDKVDIDALWRLAHEIETEDLGWQSGIQDQIAASYGGVLFIEVNDYPDANVSRLELEGDTLRELQEGLVLVHLGGSRSSSRVHEEVIKKLENEGGRSRVLRALRELAIEAKDALEGGDLAGFGSLMRQNTEAQRALHPNLVPEAADEVIALAEKLGALGWKVNGAGGEGGSLTILASDTESRAAIEQRVGFMGTEVTTIPVRINLRGIAVTERKID